MTLRGLLSPVILLCCICCGGEVRRPAPTPVPPAESARQAPSASSEPLATVDDQAEALLAAYRRAAGPSALDTLTSLRATGITFRDDEKANRRLVIQTVIPGQYRQYEAPVDGASRQLLSIMGLNGPKGWRVGNGQLAGDGLSTDPNVRQRAITLAARQNYINALAGMVPWALRADASITLTAAPMLEGDAPGQPAILISTEDGPAGRLYFDTSTSLPSTFVAPYQTHIRRQGGEYRMTFTDYRPIDGLLLPFAVTRDGESGVPTRWAFSAYTVNPALDAAEFAPPVR